MRTVVIILTVILFFGCLAVGIMISERFASFESNPLDPSPTLQAATNSYQYNLLLVHVNTLQSPTPQLNSAWGILVSLQPPPSLMFVPLYPNQDAGINEKLNNTFTVRDGSQLSTAFVDALKNELQLSFSSTFLIDDVGVQTIANWLEERTGQDLPDDAAGNWHSLEAFTFSQVCTQVENGAPALREPFAWDFLFPLHAYTNLPFQTVMSHWSTLTQSAEDVTCEVFPDS